MRSIGADELRELLSMTGAIDALEAGFRDGDPSVTPPRSSIDTPAGSLLLMPASGTAGVGVKLVALTPSNPERGLPFISAVYVLFDLATQTPEAVIDGAALTALRTAAVSGLATRHLAGSPGYLLRHRAPPSLIPDRPGRTLIPKDVLRPRRARAGPPRRR